MTAISLIHKSEDPAVSLFHGDETPPGLVQVRLHDGRLKLYDHVINTATLPCLRAMDITSAKLSPAQSTALRELQYGPSTKIGVEFKTAWWEDACTMKKYGKYGPIVGGQSSTDRMIRTVVYPSYGVKSGRKSTVLVVSYTWTADAIQWSSLLGKESEEQLRNIEVRDLAAVHGFDETGLKFLKEHGWRTMRGAGPTTRIQWVWHIAFVHLLCFSSNAF